jgi:hypothetical protein
MRDGRKNYIIEDFMKYKLDINWFKEIYSLQNTESEAFAQDYNIDYFILRLLQFIKKTLGIIALKMPILQLIELLKYEKISELEAKDAITRLKQYE